MKTKHLGNIQNEWYTPSPIIRKVKEVLGEIDVDPASCEEANVIVGAKKYFDIENSGLSGCNEWNGRIFMNPPFEAGLIDKFINKLLIEIRNEHVVEAITLTHNCTDSQWFHDLVKQSSITCFLKKRVSFWRPGQDKNTPAARGQTLCYFGSNAGTFYKVFSGYGLIMRLCDVTCA